MLQKLINLLAAGWKQDESYGTNEYVTYFMDGILLLSEKEQNMLQEVIDLLDAAGWKQDESYGFTYVTYFMDETDEAFIRVWENGTWEVWEYGAKRAAGRGAESLDDALHGHGNDQ